MSHATVNKKLAVLFALADVAFSNAQEVLHHIQEQKISTEDPAYPGLVTGIVISYARPFGENRGLGSLPPEFRQVGKLGLTDLQPIHQYMMDMRNKLFAHFDLSKFDQLIEGVNGLRPPDEIEIDFEELGFRITTNELRLPHEFLALVHQLIFVQRTRLAKAMHDHLGAWLGQRPPLGKYRLTETGLTPLPPETPAATDQRPSFGS